MEHPSGNIAPELQDNKLVSIRASGGSVTLIPEMSRGGALNVNHVDVTTGLELNTPTIAPVMPKFL